MVGFGGKVIPGGSVKSDVVEAGPVVLDDGMIASALDERWAIDDVKIEPVVLEVVVDIVEEYTRD